MDVMFTTFLIIYSIGKNNQLLLLIFHLNFLQEQMKKMYFWFPSLKCYYSCENNLQRNHLLCFVQAIFFQNRVTACKITMKLINTWEYNIISNVMMTRKIVILRNINIGQKRTPHLIFHYNASRFSTSNSENTERPLFYWFIWKAISSKIIPLRLQDGFCVQVSGWELTSQGEMNK